MTRLNLVGALAVAPALVAVPRFALADGNPARGEKKFADCAACHSLQEGMNTVGPSPQGVFNRKAGALADFRYSPAMKRSGIVWNAQTHRRILERPAKNVPANRMPYGGNSDAGERADLIAYLAQATK